MTETTNPRPTLEQPHYFTGQLLTAAGLNSNLSNEWERRWTHNRALHGTGIVTGLTVTGEPRTPTVMVEPGHAIDPAGRELILTETATLQVPPLPGAVSEDGTVTPARVVLICRWNETPAASIATGPCSAQGVAGFLETPRLEFIAESEYPQHAPNVVALATIGIASCVIYDLDFARRRVLGARPLPYVDAGVYTPAADQWEPVLSAGSSPTMYGLRTVVDTSVGGFATTPTYQVRLAGERWGEVDGDGTDVPFMFWTPAPNIIAADSTSIEVEVLIPTVQSREHFPELGFVEWMTLQRFVDLIGGESVLLELVVDQLEWAITWVGVEGTL